ncbi:MAG: DUF2380 domain-containing protein [Rhodobacteraceae bacterium]|nr:MAG: DUF2380 domain-containing protein [Paracoccaceae bacterium]
MCTRNALAAALAAFLAAGAASAEAKRAAFFGMKVIDMSLGGNQDAEEARARMLEQQLVETLEASGRFAFVDIEPVAADAARFENLAHCNGCDSEFAARLGADVAITGEVQKTSNLILHISVYLRDAATGALIGGGSADIRGNTDESWRRGMDFVLNRRILVEP